MSIFPKVVSWPDEWTCLCSCDTRDSHYLLIHLLDVFTNDGLPAKDVRGPKDRLAIWVPKYIESEAHSRMERIKSYMLNSKGEVVFAATPIQPAVSVSEPIDIPLPDYEAYQLLSGDTKPLRTRFHKTSASELLLLFVEAPFFALIAGIGIFYSLSVFFLVQLTALLRRRWCCVMDCVGSRCT